jgi:hypothetical protein
VDTVAFIKSTIDRDLLLTTWPVCCRFSYFFVDGFLIDSR